MFFKRVIISLFLLVFSCVSVFAQGQIFNLKQKDLIACSRERIFAVYDFLNDKKPNDKKDFSPAYCGAVKKAVKMPKWLQEDLEKMSQNEVWEMETNNGTERISENELWRAPLAAIYKILEIAEDIDKGATLASGKVLEEFSNQRIYLIWGIERLKENPELLSSNMRESMQGRGRSILATLDLAVKEVDSMSEAFLSSNWKSKFRKSSVGLAILANTIYNDIIKNPAPKQPEIVKEQPRTNDLLIHVLMTIGSLLVMYATYMLVERKNAQITRVVQEYMQKSNTWADDYSRQFLNINVKYIVLGTLAAFSIFGILFAITAGGFVGIFMFCVFFALGAVVGLKMPGMILDSLKKKRGAKINKQLMDALILMSNALKSGMDIVQGFEMVSTDLQPPISDEFGLVIKNYKLGTPFEKSLENMEERVESRLLSYMVKAIILQRQVGGNLTKIFARIVENIREESKLEEKLQAMTAQQRIQSIVVAVMPWLMVSVLFIFQPDVMIKFYTKVTGIIILFVCIIWIMIGMKMVKKLGEIKV